MFGCFSRIKYTIKYCGIYVAYYENDTYVIYDFDHIGHPSYLPSENS